MGRANRSSTAGGALRGEAGGIIDPSTGRISQNALRDGDFADILRRHDPGRFESDTYVHPALEEIAERGENICSRKEDGSLGGSAGLLLEQSESEMFESAHKKLMPNQASLPMLEADSEEDFHELLRQSEDRASRSGKEELLLLDDIYQGSNRASALFQRGYKIVAASESDGQFVYSKNLLEEPTRPPASDLSDARKMSAGSWKDGHFNPLNTKKIDRADPTQPLTISFYDDEDSGWAISNSFPQYAGDPLFEAMKKSLQEGRQIEKLERGVDENGRWVTTWAFSEAGRENSVPSSDSLRAAIYDSAPSQDFLSDRSNGNIRDRYYEAASAAGEADQAREAHFRAMQDAQQRGLVSTPEEDRSLQRMQEALRETEASWSRYREALGTQGSEKKIQEAEKQLRSFRRYYGS